MAKKKHVTKHATNINNNKNEVHIHLGERKKRAKKRKATNPRSSHPYAPQFSSQIPQPLTPQFYVNRPQTFDPMTQSQRETILGQVPVPVPVQTPVQTPHPVAIAIPAPHEMMGGFTTPYPHPYTPPLYDDMYKIPKSHNYDKYNDIYKNDSLYSSDILKSPPHTTREYTKAMFDADMESAESDTEIQHPGIVTTGAFAEHTPQNIAQKKIKEQGRCFPIKSETTRTERTEGSVK